MASDKYGINMKKFCKAHEAAVTKDLADRGPSRALLDLHLEKLRWLQHERLVHLIVLVMTAMAELFVVDLALLHPETGPWSAVFMLGLAVLLAFYFAHYFFLENTVQHWYRISDEIREGLTDKAQETRQI